MVGAVSHILPSAERIWQTMFVSPYAEAARVRREGGDTSKGDGRDERNEAVSVETGSQNSRQNALLLYTRRAKLTNRVSTVSADASEDARSRSKSEADKAKEAVLQELRACDREVRQHEQAHKGALGPYAAGGISYTYTTGPDGQQYAVGGSVPVDLSEEDSPEKTMEKAQTIKRAAYAAKESSGDDRQVAAAAQQLESAAQIKLAQKEREGEKEGEAAAPG